LAALLAIARGLALLVPLLATAAALLGGTVFWSEFAKQPAEEREGSRQPEQTAARPRRGQGVGKGIEDVSIHGRDLQCQHQIQRIVFSRRMAATHASSTPCRTGRVSLAWLMVSLVTPARITGF
jgi:hypothetical protein